ncbi:MAG: methyltransferase [Ferruginibacter sp.]
MFNGNTNDPDKLLFLAHSFIISQCLYVAAKLDIAETVSKRSVDVRELAELTNANPDVLSRILRLLYSVGIFRQNENGKVELTPVAGFLRSDMPGTIKNFILMIGQDWHWKTWGHFYSSTQTGKPTVEELYGMNVFDFLEKNAEAGEILDRVFDDFTKQLGSFLVRHYDFCKVKKVIDIGGGRGGLWAEVVKKNKELEVCIYDMPRVGREYDPPERTAEGGINYLQGNFFENIPMNGDVYMMKNILHDWGDEQAKRIISNCYKAMADHSVLLVMESVVSNDSGMNFTKFLDLEMFIIGGRERTLSQYEELLAPHFRCTRVQPLAFSQSLMEFKKI